MTPEALKPQTTPATPEISELERQEKITLITELEERLEAVETARDRLKDEMIKAETSKDWTPVKEAEESLRSKLAQAKTTQRQLEGKGIELMVSAEYSYKNEKGETVNETIELNFETEISSTLEFYQKHKIEPSLDFREQMQSLWEENISDIEQAITEKGFNKLLFIPDNLPKLKDLEAKMTTGYEEEKGNKTYWGIEGEADAITDLRNGARLVLVHSAPDLTAQPELKKTLGTKYGGEKENGKDNKAQDFIDQGEGLTLSEYLILQREVFENTETHIHLDSKKTPDDSYIYWTWLPGSKVGSRVVYASWNPDDGRLRVSAGAPDGSSPSLGCRPSRCFSKK